MTQSELKELLDYNSDTGIFTWKVNIAKNVKVGHIAGNVKDTGYIRIKINKKMYLAHHLAFLYVFNSIPSNMIDHINGNRADNRLCNLREVTNAENQYNSKINSKNNSGYKNVSWNKARNKWIVQLKINGKQKFIGYFDDLEFADLVAQEARNKYHKEFANHG